MTTWSIAWRFVVLAIVAAAFLLFCGWALTTAERCPNWPVCEEATR